MWGTAMGRVSADVTLRRTTTRNRQRGDAQQTSTDLRATGKYVGVTALGLSRPTTRDLFGHFHAATFSYGPLKRGRIDLNETVATLFETESLVGVLHLLHDTREVVGIGQSEFTRGACWAGPASGWEIS